MTESLQRVAIRTMILDMDTTARERVAAEVRAELARKDIPIAELAAATGINLRVLGRKLSGSSPIGVEELISIATALDVRPSALIQSAHLAAAAA